MGSSNDEDAMSSLPKEEEELEIVGGNSSRFRSSSQNGRKDVVSGNLEKRGKSIIYATMDTFQSKEEALSKFSKSYMAANNLRWKDTRVTDCREVKNFSCTVGGCHFCGRLIFDSRDNSFIHEEIDGDNPGNDREPGDQHSHNLDTDKDFEKNPDSDLENSEIKDRGLLEEQKEWSRRLYATGFKTKMQVFNQMTKEKLNEEKAGTDLLPVIPALPKLQTFLCRSYLLMMDY
jgi:hypothetical protein